MQRQNDVADFHCGDLMRRTAGSGKNQGSLIVQIHHKTKWLLKQPSF